MTKRNPYLYGPATPKARHDAAQRFYGHHLGEREERRRQAFETRFGEGVTFFGLDMAKPGSDRTVSWVTDRKVDDGAIDMVKGADGVYRCPA